MPLATGLAVLMLFMEFGLAHTFIVKVIINIIDFSLLFLFAFEIVLKFIGQRNVLVFVRQYWFDILFFIVFTILFIMSKYTIFQIEKGGVSISGKLILARNIFVILKIITRINKLNYLINKFTKNPAQTMILSFFFLIVAGALLLILPYSVNPDMKINIMDSFFTSVSAVCVTGLITVDTQTVFSIFGKTVIMILIQAGGLGILLFGYLTAFIMKKKVSLEDKMAVKYVVNAENMQTIEKTVIKILTFTFAIEFIGMLMLLPVFRQAQNNVPFIFNALFHSVSAFCNAGFALFSNSFESFKSVLLLNITIIMLIVLGGLGFSVMDNLFSVLRDRILRRFKKSSIIAEKLTLNSKIVLIMTFSLIIIGTFLIYGFEHGRSLAGLHIETSYITAFFQSVTLRTAGFNSTGIGVMSTPVLIIMMVFMFIGGGSGSTAGGVKVNTVAVIIGYIKSLLNSSDDTVMFKEFINRSIVLRAFTIVIIGIIIIIAAFFSLSITESFSSRDIIFEVISAFGTVGLTTGITGQLSPAGKFIIMLTMFAGRLGFLTIIAALTKASPVKVKYPSGYINIG